MMYDIGSLKPFFGTGERNEAGLTLEEFLERYDPKKYDCPSNTVDIAVFRKSSGTIMPEGLKLLLVRRRNHPSIGYWALPGGFVDLKENLEDAAARELEEETGVTGVSLKQYHTWGAYDRDPRWRVITTLYFTILDEDIPVKAGDDAADARWFDVTYEEEKQGEGRSMIRLRLRDPDSSLLLEASADCIVSGEGPMRSHRLIPRDSTLIAGDHALLIMDTVRYIASFRT